MKRNFPDPTEEALKESIMNVDFPQYHERDGQLYPRTSSILRLHKDGLHQLLHFGDCPRGFLRHVEWGAVHGQHVHDAVRHLLTEGILEGRIRHSNFTADDFEIESNQVEPPNQSVASKVERFLKWLRKEQTELLLPPEKTVVSPVLDYAGTPDLLLRRSRKNHVVDIKTGGNIHESHWMQVQAYAQLIEKETGVTVHKIGILLLGAKNSSGISFAVRDLTEERRERFYRLVDRWYELFPEPFQEAYEESGRYRPQIPGTSIQVRFSNN